MPSSAPAVPKAGGGGAFSQSDAEQQVLARRHSLVCLEVVGSAFLWHQIRCVVAVMMLIGRRLEAPQAMADLLLPPSDLLRAAVQKS